MTKNKINWLLILQGWAMLWVVIGHAPLSIEDMPPFVSICYHFAYSFHMPLFIMISGWLFYKTRIESQGVGPNNWTWGGIMRDKLIRLGIPYVVFTIIAMAAKCLFPGDMERTTSFTFSELIHAIIYPGSGALGEMWFIACIMWYFMLYPLWRVVLKRHTSIWIVLLLLVVVHFARAEYQYFNISLLCIGTMLEYIIWFYIGLVLSRLDIMGLITKNNVYPWLLFFVGSALYVTMRYFNIIFGGTVFAIVLSFGLAFLFDRYYPKLYWTFRNYTYQIFLMGIFFQIVIKMLYKRVDMPYYVFYVFCILAGLYLPVLITIVLQKINNKYVLMCVGLKKQNNF